MSIENVWYRLGLLSELAVTQIKTELKADAIKTIKVINRIGRNPDYRNFGLKKLSVDLAQEGISPKQRKWWP
jgi:pyruvate/2-oxoglutarate dehydrogenase complex dihydrolipoamide dehydrogenase (E3) component